MSTQKVSLQMLMAPSVLTSLVPAAGRGSLGVITEGRQRNLVGDTFSKVCIGLTTPVLTDLFLNIPLTFKNIADKCFFSYRYNSIEKLCPCVQF